MFAIVVGQSFIFLSAPQRFPTWIASRTENAEQLLDTVLAYILVIGSWVGFHKSVKEQAIRNVSRFIIDIALLFLYYLAFVNVESLNSTFLILFAAFVGYFLW